MTTSNSSGQSGQFDFWQWLTRLIAYIIDAAIITVVSVIIGVIVAISIVLTGAFFLFVGYGLFFFTFGLLSILYFIIMDVYWGATIGKKTMGLEVQPETGGGRISLSKSFIRNISKIFWLFLFLDWLIAVVTTGNDRRQKITDRWGGTTVVQVKQVLQPPSSSSPPPPPPPPPPPT